MIKIEQKYQCSGCAACSAICPKDCIRMEDDPEGFKYPVVDTSKCIDCHLCEKACPIIHVPAEHDIQDVIAAKNNDNLERLNSSSGGVFRLLATSIIADGGVVAGVAFDESLTARHVLATSESELEALMSSKYVQSDTDGIFQKVRQLLADGKKVMFSGVPCQVAGLRNYLIKPYPNLITVDILCHGVPSPKFFKEYKTMLEHQYDSRIKSLSFRNKQKSWKRLHTKASFENNRNYFKYSGYDSYMQLFLSDRLQRPSCFKCPYNTLHRPGDISLGDFWGIGKTHYGFDDDKGVSMVLINTPSGKLLWDRIKEDTTSFTSTIEEAVAGNKVLVQHLPSSEKRDEFYKEYTSKGFTAAVNKFAPVPSRFYQVYRNTLRWGLDIVRKVKKESF